MVVPQWKLAKLPVETVTAHVVSSRWADAVTAPGTEGPDDLVQHRVIRVNGASLSHRRMVRRVEAGGTDISNGA